MSKYTTELRFICEELAGLKESVGYPSVKEIVEKARKSIFDFDYPIFDEQYKPTLETKIIKHYYTREIGFETYSLWKLKLETLMNEIMPYYNQLYESELLKFDPFRDTDYTLEHEGNKRNDATKTGTINDEGSYDETRSQTGRDVVTTESMDKYADTPQDTVTNLLQGRYLTNARNIDATNTTVYGNDINTIGNNDKLTTFDTLDKLVGEDYFLNKYHGKMNQKSYSEMLKEFRDTFLNIDMMVVNDLKNLFMLLW